MILDKESESTCSDIIRNCAEKYDSVSFRPHITLAGTPDWSENKLIKVIDEIVDQKEPFKLSTQKVLCKSAPYQKITLGIAESSFLNYLHLKTDTFFEGNYSKKDYPHISYLYSNVSCKQIDEEDLDNIQKRSPKKVFVNQAALVHCKGTPREWRMLYRCALNN